MLTNACSIPAASQEKSTLRYDNSIIVPDDSEDDFEDNSSRDRDSESVVEVASSGISWSPASSKYEHIDLTKKSSPCAKISTVHKLINPEAHDWQARSWTQDNTSCQDTPIVVVGTRTSTVMHDEETNTTQFDSSAFAQAKSYTVAEETDEIATSSNEVEPTLSKQSASANEILLDTIVLFSRNELSTENLNRHDQPAATGLSTARSEMAFVDVARETTPYEARSTADVEVSSACPELAYATDSGISGSELSQDEVPDCESSQDEQNDVSDVERDDSVMEGSSTGSDEWKYSDDDDHEADALEEAYSITERMLESKDEIAKCIQQNIKLIADLKEQRHLDLGSEVTAITAGRFTTHPEEDNEDDFDPDEELDDDYVSDYDEQWDGYEVGDEMSAAEPTNGWVFKSVRDNSMTDALNEAYRNTVKDQASSPGPITNQPPSQTPTAPEPQTASTLSEATGTSKNALFPLTQEVSETASIVIPNPGRNQDDIHKLFKLRPYTSEQTPMIDDRVTIQPASLSKTTTSDPAIMNGGASLLTTKDFPVLNTMYANKATLRHGQAVEPQLMQGTLSLDSPFHYQSSLLHAYDRPPPMIVDKSQAGTSQAEWQVQSPACTNSVEVVCKSIAARFITDASHIQDESYKPDQASHSVSEPTVRDEVNCTSPQASEEITQNHATRTQQAQTCLWSCDDSPRSEYCYQTLMTSGVSRAERASSQTPTLPTILGKRKCEEISDVVQSERQDSVMSGTPVTGTAQPRPIKKSRKFFDAFKYAALGATIGAGAVFSALVATAPDLI